MKTAGLAACLLLMSFQLAGCSRQETAWRHVDALATVPAYEAYLRDYPAGAHVEAARLRIAELREQQEWQRALRLNTPEAFQRYLSGYPDGSFAVAARQKLSDFLLAKAPDLEPGSPAPAGAPATRGTLIEAARPGGDYRVQLGAFSKGEEAAGNAWRDLSSLHADLLGSLTPRVKVMDRGGRRLWRLQAGPLDQQQAQEICRLLKARGSDCIVVHD